MSSYRLTLFNDDNVVRGSYLNPVRLPQTAKKKKPRIFTSFRIRLNSRCVTLTSPRSAPVTSCHFSWRRYGRVIVWGFCVHNELLLIRNGCYSGNQPVFTLHYLALALPCREKVGLAATPLRRTVCVWQSCGLYIQNVLHVLYTCICFI